MYVCVCARACVCMHMCVCVCVCVYICMYVRNQILEHSKLDYGYVFIHLP